MKRIPTHSSREDTMTDNTAINTFLNKGKPHTMTPDGIIDATITEIGETDNPGFCVDFTYNGMSFAGGSRDTREEAEQFISENLNQMRQALANGERVDLKSAS